MNYDLNDRLEELKKEPAERLRDWAGALRRQAHTMRQGVSFYSEHPADAMEREARDLELAADALDEKKNNGSK